jgi:hypothetical protein
MRGCDLLQVYAPEVGIGIQSMTKADDLYCCYIVSMPEVLPISIRMLSISL